jgi:hypothetical protein
MHIDRFNYRVYNIEYIIKQLCAIFGETWRSPGPVPMCIGYMPCILCALTKVLIHNQTMP